MLLALGELMTHHEGHLGCEQENTLSSLMLCDHNASACVEIKVHFWMWMSPWCVAGTLLTARLALQHKLACNTAGGTHHAFPDAGSGFCIINDLAITARVLLQESLVQRVLILDLDVHQV